MAPRWISPRVMVETANYGSNNSVINGGDGLIRVDSPHRRSDAVRWRQVVAGIGDVRFIVNTDHHPDHTIGNREMPGEVVSHAETRRRLLSEAPSMEYLRSLFERLDPEGLPMLEGYEVRVPTIVFETSMALHLADATLELTYQPGHTRNSLLAYLPEDRVIFTGDIVCEAGLPSFQDSRLTDWFDALDVVGGYDFEYVVPGHGEVTDRAGVDRYRQMGRAVVAEVADRISRGQEIDQVVAEVRFDDNIHVAMDGCAGYPDDLIEMFQMKSITRVYTDVQETPGLVHR